MENTFMLVSSFIFFLYFMVVSFGRLQRSERALKLWQRILLKLFLTLIHYQRFFFYFFILNLFCLFMSFLRVHV